jgi:hypothetical protein
VRRQGRHADRGGAFAVPLSCCWTGPGSAGAVRTSLFAVITLGWLCTGASYLLFFHIIASAGAVVSLNNFLVRCSA